MQKYVLILLSLLTPFGIWCAGCRQETGRAPMPKGPETARLARAPGAGVDESIKTPPTIPALIDPEVLAAPDQPTFERIRAVMDREANLASSMNNTGLFVLPRQDYYPEMALAPQSPPRASPEIWSRPVQAMPGTPRVNLSPELYSEVSAMAPPAPFEPPAANRLEAYPAYSMPDTTGLTPLTPMVLPNAPAASLLLPPPPTVTLPAQSPIVPVNQGSEVSGVIPGLYFGPDDLLVSALSDKPGAEETKEVVTADYFSNPNLGLLASVTSLDDLTSLFFGETPKPVEAAPPGKTVALAPPWTEPAQSISESPTSSSGLLDFSMSKLIDTPPASPIQNEAEPHVGDLGVLAPLSVPPAIPVSPESAGRAVPAPTSKPANEAMVLEDISPPPLLSLENLPQNKGFADTSATGSLGADSATWDAFKPPVKLDRQSAVLDPLIDYDFSAFAKREEKQASQKIKLTPAGGKPERKKPSSSSVEPEAPPLL